MSRLRFSNNSSPWSFRSKNPWRQQPTNSKLSTPEPKRSSNISKKQAGSWQRQSPRGTHGPSECFPKRKTYQAEALPNLRISKGGLQFPRGMRVICAPRSRSPLRWSIPPRTRFTSFTPIQSGTSSDWSMRFHLWADWYKSRSLSEA